MNGSFHGSDPAKVGRHVEEFVEVVSRHRPLQLRIAGRTASACHASFVLRRVGSKGLLKAKSRCLAQVTLRSSAVEPWPLGSAHGRDTKHRP